MVESTLGLVAANAESKGLELLGLVHHSVLTALRGDAERLRQVLTNLLNNALKFTKRGKVVLRVSQQSETALGVVLRFEVKDTGIGISSEAQEHLFEPFSQENSSTTGKYGGAGLGLAIARQLVGMMQGEIGVESELEKGATFWFTAHFEKQAAALRADENQESLVGTRVLIVNDNCSNSILRLHLANLGMRFSASSSCLEALELLRQNRGGKWTDPFRLAVLDLAAPRRSMGLILADPLERIVPLAATRLILLTSAGQRMNMDLFRAVGIVESVAKPITQSSLQSCLNNKALPLPEAITNFAVAEQSPVVLSERQTAHRAIRILLAEDNLINQKVALHQLEKCGYRATTVDDGIEVLNALACRPYDIILMDCQMPEMDGYEATRAIRKREQSLETMIRGNRRSISWL